MSNKDPLEWLAFCYIADELPAGERRLFEERLSSDQAAREAVAEAVLLTGLVHEAVTAPIASLASTPLDRASRAWTMVALTAAAVAMLTIFLPRNNTSHRNTQIATGIISTSSAELAAQWLNAGEQLGMNAVEQLTSDSDFLILADFEIDANEEIPIVLESPSWMLAAVNSLSEEGNN